MNLFGKKKQAPAPKLADSIRSLREASDNLQKREDYLQLQMQAALAEAKKKSKAKDKRGALFQLKRKKMYEKQLDQIYGKKTNIEMQIMALESAASNKEVLGAMRGGAVALQRAVIDTNVEKVDDVMDDINEAMALADELGEAMSQSIGPAMDEDELNSELQEMESEMVDEELISAPAIPVKALPSPAVAEPAAPVKVAGKPVKEPAKALSKEDEELRALELQMGM